eukprot:351773-Chlamydomonas_euryale.AAC.27
MVQLLLLRLRQNVLADLAANVHADPWLPNAGPLNSRQLSQFIGDFPPPIRPIPDNYRCLDNQDVVGVPVYERFRTTMGGEGCARVCNGVANCTAFVLLADNSCDLRDVRVTTLIAANASQVVGVAGQTDRSRGACFKSRTNGTQWMWARWLTDQRLFIHTSVVVTWCFPSSCLHVLSSSNVNSIRA